MKKNEEKCFSMNPSSSVGNSMVNLSSKNGSPMSKKKKRTNSNDTIPFVDESLRRDSSSGFNYQNLDEKSTKTRIRAPVRSQSSSNAEFHNHLQQLKQIGKRENDEKIRLTSSNFKVQCDEQGTQTSIQTSMEMKIIERTIVNNNVPPRDSWDHKIEFLLAVIGYAVDLGNVWRFPTAVCKNGGGAFFIPYFVLLIFGGLPLFYMELALGQYHRSGIFTVWKHICPLVKGVGWATVLINFMMAMFYNTIISWAMFYLVMSFRGIASEVPWKNCRNKWNTACCVAAQHSPTNSFPSQNRTNLFSLPKNCTEFVYSTEEYFYRRVQQVQNSDGFNNLGEIRWELAFCLFIVFIFVYFALWKGIKSSGKAVWVTAIAPYVVLFILLIRGVTLTGASMGIRYYLKPNMTLLNDFAIWNAAATQIFFSLGPGFGVLLALSSYNKFHNNCYRDALMTSSINCVTSVLAGFVVFSTLGHMAKVSQKTVEQVIEDKGSELIFIVYPHTIALMKGSTIWAILFFFMLITLGIDSTFGGLESIITGLCDEFPNIFGRHRSSFVFVVLIICYLGALPTCTNGGEYIVNLMNDIAVAPSILLVVFIECIAVSWCYGVNRFSQDIKSMIGSRPSIFWRAIWCFISPIFLSSIFYISMKDFLFGNLEIKRIKLRDLPVHVQVWSYLIVFVPILCIPGYAIYKLMISPGNDISERFERALRPEEIVNEHEISDL